MQFDNSKIRGKIREIFGTEQKFSDAVGISKSALSAKLNNNSEINRDEMLKMVELLKIKKRRYIWYIFFNHLIRILRKRWVLQTSEKNAGRNGEIYYKKVRWENGKRNKGGVRSDDQRNISYHKFNNDCLFCSRNDNKYSDDKKRKRHFNFCWSVHSFKFNVGCNKFNVYNSFKVNRKCCNQFLNLHILIYTLLALAKRFYRISS